MTAPKYYHMDLSALANDIRADADKQILIIDAESDTDILTDDLEERRPINYHIVPPTEEWIDSLIRFASGAKRFEQIYRQLFIKALSRTDLDMLITLRKIFVINSINDISECAAVLDPDANTMIPDEYQLDDSDELADAPVGMFWSWESAIIINMTAITKCTDELDKDFEQELGYSDHAGIEHEGIMITLLHELRHLGLSNPYLPEIKASSKEQSEELVEQWARNEYERIHYETDNIKNHQT